jgi:hypothetical protein
VKDVAVVDSTPKDGTGDAVESGKLDGAIHEGEWVPSSFSEVAGCLVEKPADLSAVTKAQWVPCQDGGVECALLDTSYLPGANNMILASPVVIGGSNSPRFKVERGIGSTIRSPTIYDLGNGDALAAWRVSVSQSDFCGLIGLGIKQSEAALIVYPTEAVMGQTDVAIAILIGTPQALMDGVPERYDLPFSSINYNGMAALDFSPALVAARLQPSGRLLVANRPGGKFVEVPKPVDGGWVEFGVPVIAGADVIVDLMGPSSQRLVVRHADGVVEDLHADKNRAIALLGGDGDWLAWQEGYNGSLSGGFENVELWAAKPDGNPSTFAPFKVAELPWSGSDSHMTFQYAYGSGWYLFQPNPMQVRLTRIPDGKHADLTPPAGYAFLNPIGVLAGDAWVLLRKSPGSTYPSTVARFALDALSLQ